MATTGTEKPADFALRIKGLRARFGLTQTRLADLLGVSFASVNRWENGQTRPSTLAWKQLIRAEEQGLAAFDAKPAEPSSRVVSVGPPSGDFTADATAVWAVAEAHRLGHGHLFNPAFATETSLIDPLPHQRIAVYERMLSQPRLRFLLADDAGAGKTIMTGLYIREMLSRRLVRRVLIVAPAGLLGNWEREMRTLFNLPFAIASGGDARVGNPFLGSDSGQVIISLDTLASDRTFQRLQEREVAPYDLVVFDEAHKLSADRQPDLTVRRTDRYKLAEALAGIPTSDARWRLDWAPQHLLLLTATPHMGKDLPYFYLWRLLEPETLPTFDAFVAYPPDARHRHFIRRTKEEMVRFDGTRIYPTRVSDTLSYELAQGDRSEQRLYDETTEYIRTYYNRARILNRSAARLAMSVFQRRLASSTWAVLRSFERRLARLDELIDDIRSGRITPEALGARQRRLDDEPDVLDEATADEERATEGREENEVAEDRLLGGVVAVSLAELEAERVRVRKLLELARDVEALGAESKFEKLREVLHDPRFKDEKFLVFTEHRDTLDFLVRRLEGLGFTGRIASIHGGMSFTEREAQVEFFRRPTDEGGASYLVCTDAAGEGINLQFCWLMINYDVPWNPARLEQRMGRIHRYGQPHDPVQIVNLVAGRTREGRVVATLLEKLERVRKELGSDKVFDVVGRLFEGVSMREYMESAVTDEGADRACRDLGGKLTKEQVAALEERERHLFGEGGDVKAALESERAKLAREELRRLLPGYVRRFVERAVPLLDLSIEGSLDGEFSLRSLRPFALEPLWPALEAYPEERRDHLSVVKPRDPRRAIFLHPGEPVFDRLRSAVSVRFGADALRGAVFVDPHASRPYVFHLAAVSVVRRADDAFPLLAREELLEYRLVAVGQFEDGSIEECAIEQLLILRGATGVPPTAIGMAGADKQKIDTAREWIVEHLARPASDGRRERLLAALPDREDFLRRGFDYQEADLLSMRTRLAEKAQAGDARAKADLVRLRESQRALADRRRAALSVLRREPELIEPDDVAFIVHALVVPSTDPEDRKRHDAEVEALAVKVVLAFEGTHGARVRDVSTPVRAVAAGLTEHPGFDILSRWPSGEERAIEVKGRAGVGDVELTENEWAKACNLRGRYWLYVVYDCASPQPRLFRVRDPFHALIARARGGVIVDEKAILAAAAE